MCPTQFFFDLKENSAIVNTRVRRTTLHPSDHLRLTPRRGDPPNRASCHPRRPMRGEKSKRQRREFANALAHEIAIMRDHLFLQAKNADLLSKSGASMALAAAKSSTNCMASSLHLPPVSNATTTNRHRSPDNNSKYFRSLSWRAPTDSPIFHCRIGARCAAHGQNASQHDVLCQLCSMVEWKPSRQHLDSPLIIGWHRNVHVTQLAVATQVAPASRHTLASVFSGAMARVLNLLEREHAARCRP